MEVATQRCNPSFGSSWMACAVYIHHPDHCSNESVKLLLLHAVTVLSDLSVGVSCEFQLWACSTNPGSASFGIISLQLVVIHGAREFLTSTELRYSINYTHTILKPTWLISW